MSVKNSSVSAVILAGGRAQRMGGVDKGLLRFHNAALVARIGDALAPQVGELFINANRNLAAYRRFGYSVIADKIADYQGPLAGMHAALKYAAKPWLLTIPCDGPFVAADYAARMLRTATAQHSKLAVAHDGERLQPVYALLHNSLADDLAEFLQSGERKIDRWYARHEFATVDFAADKLMFTNINTAQQLNELQNRHRQ